MTLPRWNRVCSPNTTSTLANPQSVSTSMTSRPCAAIETAKFADTVVLPTPPLPPVTAMTLTGRAAFKSASACARSGDSLASRMGGDSSKITREIGVVAGRRRALRQLEGLPHQPDSFEMRGVKVFRYALTIAHVGDFQVVPKHGRKHGAETCRLIHLGEDAPRGLHTHEGAHDFIERLPLDLRRKRQQNACARRAVLQRRQLFGEADVARPHAGSVDQDQLLGLEPLEHAGQFLGAV